MIRHARWTGLTLLRLHSTTSVISDIPRSESQQIALSLPAEQMESTIDHGKTVDFDDHANHNVVRLVRPRKFLCVTGCGQPATVAVPGRTRGAEPERYCMDHRPRGILGIVQDGDGAA